LQYIISCFGVYPHVCEHCETHAFRSNYKQLVAAICLRVAMLGFLLIGLSYADLRIRKVANPWESMKSIVAFHFEPVSARKAMALRALTNDDIVEFIKSNMTTSFVIRVIQQEGSHFQVDAKSLTALKRDGVPEDVIMCMIQAAKALSDLGDPSNPQR